MSIENKLADAILESIERIKESKEFLLIACDENDDTALGAVITEDFIANIIDVFEDNPDIFQLFKQAVVQHEYDLT